MALSCEGARHNVPSPLVGEGQGGGWQRSTEREADPMRRDENGDCQLFRLSDKIAAVRGVPPSLSLPHRGGGNDVARLCPSPDIHSRVLFKVLSYSRTLRAGVSGLSPARWRASVSRPVSSHSPLTARAAQVSQRSVQSPSE